jgi:hypothetical protein
MTARKLSINVSPQHQCKIIYNINIKSYLMFLSLYIMCQCSFSWTPTTLTGIGFQDEGTFQMKQPARDLLKRLGSKRAQVIGWRDMWAMVTQKGAKMFGEAYSKSTEFDTWGAPVVLRTEIPLVPTEGLILFLSVIPYVE